MKHLVATLAALLLAVPSAAQLNLRVDQRVRVVAPSAGVTASVTGTVVGFRGDTVLLQLSEAQVQVPLAAISRIEVSRGRSRALTGAVGAVAGAGAGYALAVRADRREGTDHVKVPCELSLECPLEFHFVPVDRFGSRERALYTAAGLASGLAVGAIVGWERWKRVPLYAGYRPAARRGELAVRLPL